MNERLREILKKNSEFEKESPYNYCDRWCEQCEAEKQDRCGVYEDEFEQKITCIAYGREPGDPEITSEVLEKQYEGLDEGIEERLEELDMDFDTGDDSEFEKIKQHIIFFKL